MTMRALIVFLAVLNLGVAAWWVFRADPVVAGAETAPSGIARLQLVSERPDLRPATTAPPPDPAPGDNAIADAPAPPADAAERCLRLGPFAEPPALAAAQAALRPLARRVRTEEVREGDGRGWRVYLPPAGDRAAADAVAERLREAGFTDLLVVANGDEANSIALGRFSTEPRARQHAKALAAAGFAARAEPLGAQRATLWLEAATPAGTDPGTLRRIVGAAQARDIDCAGLR